MKIDDSVKKTGSLGVQSTQGQTRAGKGVSKTSTGGVSSDVSSDTVQLSSQLQGLEGQVASSSVFDANKVEEIKAAIAGGQFQVNPENVATGLINNVSDLLQTQTA
ncbi:MAG TPA: flagellar biosynthesis anti-sigma factor FlgM [Burkholderiaceae bacterium]|nr:flagellar biosynthesis anti-sigma factor FlgM [Burkholderiaceae bacterium]